MNAKKILSLIIAVLMIMGTMASVSAETATGLSGTGSAEDPYKIKNLNDLIFFRDSVNAGETKYNADGVYVALGANIDMADVDWSVNIGDACNATFDGIFDGKGYTISNLKSTETAQMSDGYICTGLFGAIGGNAVVKNFTVDGATIDTANFTGNNVAVVVGFAYEATGSVKNVTVKNAAINAEKVDGTGVIVGYAYSVTGATLTVKNCEVSDSTVTGQAYVGGIIGYAGGKAALAVNKVEEVTVNASSCAAGGVAGIMCNGSVATGNIVKGITLSSVHENWLNATGVVAGTFTGNVTIMGTDTDSAETIVGVLHANKPTDALPKAEGSVNGVYYAKHDDAVKAALAANGDVTVTLNTDVELSEPLVIDADDKITIDLNGFKVNYNSTTQGEAMITNKGNLTINDSVGTGVINYNYTGAADSTYGKGNYTISNGGTLTVNGGKITIANLSGHAKYPIDNNSTTGDAILVINGGHLYNYNTSAIRQFCNSTTNKNSVTINGGVVEGYCAIWVQNPGKNTVNGSLSITNGEIRSTAKAWVEGTAELKDVSSRIYCTIDGDGGAWSEDSAVSITGGTINENVSLAEKAPAAITIGEGATFNGYVAAPESEVDKTLPNAEVSNLGAITVNEDSYYEYNLIGGGGLSTKEGAFDLGIAMEFIAKDTPEEAAANYYGNYTTDFFIQIDGIEGGSFVGNGCYLAGYYPLFGAWVKIPLDNFTIENGVVYPVITSAGFDFKYTAICESVQDFICGIYLTPEVLEKYPELKVNLSLGLSEDLEAAKNAQFTTVGAYTYDKDDFGKQLVNWGTGTDAGFYMDGETKLGMMRFLFFADVNAEDITDSGIKYIRTDDITASVVSKQDAEATNAFYGDVTGIPDGTTGEYAAVAYIVTSKGFIYWSDAAVCSPDFTKHFTEYTAQ